MHDGGEIRSGALDQRAILADIAGVFSTRDRRLTMPKSAAFIRIKADILRIVAKIPEGRVATFGDIGRHLDVMPRHVAYILTMLGDEAKARYPWRRVVADRGRLGKPKSNSFGISQAEMLELEGLRISKSGIIEDFDSVFVITTEITG